MPSGSIDDCKGIERLVHEHYATNWSHEYSIGLLLSVELTIQSLYDDFSAALQDMYGA